MPAASAPQSGSDTDLQHRAEVELLTKLKHNSIPLTASQRDALQQMPTPAADPTPPTLAIGMTGSSTPPSANDPSDPSDPSDPADLVDPTAPAVEGTGVFRLHPEVSAVLDASKADRSQGWDQSRIMDEYEAAGFRKPEMSLDDTGVSVIAEKMMPQSIDLDLARPNAGVSWGLGLGQDHENFHHISKVAAGSAADGVAEPGDVLVLINGLDVAELPHARVVNLLAPLTKVTLTVERRVKQFNILGDITPTATSTVLDKTKGSVSFGR